ncbi:MAG: 2-oxoglutarate dehydrogenase E1 [Ktedonobacterales bacterium]
MKVITIRQPWATLIACGAKSIETRSWRPLAELKPGDRLAIHAAKTFTDDERYNVWLEPFKSCLIRAYHEGYWSEPELPLGGIIAVCTFKGAIPGDSPRLNGISDNEREFGYYGHGRWAWLLENVRAIEPIPARGKQGIWTWEPPDWMTYLDLEQVRANRAAKAAQEVSA